MPESMQMENCQKTYLYVVFIKISRQDKFPWEATLYKIPTSFYYKHITKNKNKKAISASAVRQNALKILLLLLK